MGPSQTCLPLTLNVGFHTVTMQPEEVQQNNPAPWEKKIQQRGGGGISTVTKRVSDKEHLNPDCFNTH